MSSEATDPPGHVAYHHVDVFSAEPLSGNGLAVLTGADALGTETMLRIAQEIRQFETIFLSNVTGAGADARIFTPEQELTFAGHRTLSSEPQPSCTSC
jgi:trans-2,3-dihydro-3-hydroxyanthranilate isomerase